MQGRGGIVCGGSLLSLAASTGWSFLCVAQNGKNCGFSLLFLSSNPGRGRSERPLFCNTTASFATPSLHSRRCVKVTAPYSIFFSPSAFRERIRRADRDVGSASSQHGG